MLSKRKKLSNCLSQIPLAVISTINRFQNRPESALVAFTQNSHLELYFMTFVDSRKYANLQQNPFVSFVIGFDYTTIQYEGIASELKEKVIPEALQAFACKETPCTPEFLNSPRARFFKVTPKWIRYSDYTICPAEIFEFISKD